MKNLIDFRKFYSFFAIFGFLSAGFLLSGCNNDDDTPAVDPPRDIVETAIAEGYTTLAAALVEADLVSTLQGAGPFTVFAPTDAAFAAAGITATNVSQVENLREILLYHVVSGRTLSGGLSTGNVTTVNGAPIAVSVSNGITLNGNVNVVQPFDVEASNGVIHTVSAVLLPPDDTDPDPESIVDIVIGNEDFSILEAALVKAGLVETLSGSGPFTVFAPTNAAFEAAGISNLDSYTAEQLTPILLYHVLGGAVMAGDLTDGQVVSTLSEQDFYLSLNDNGVFINGTTEVTTTDVEASNGVIHIINRTLAPPTQDIVEIAIAAGFNRLAEALTEADLVGALQGDGPFTVFAPTDEAFDALYIRLGVDGPADIDAAILTNVLLYHVVEARIFSTDLSDGAMPETLLEGSTVTINFGDAVTITDVDSQSDDATVTTTDILGTNGVIHIIDQILIPIELGD